MSNKFAGGIKAGSTSVSMPVELRKSADSTELTGIVFGGVTAYYTRQGAAPVSITTQALSLATSAWATGGWKELDGTNAPGLYRLDIPDAAFASGADWVTVTVKVATAFLYVERFALEAQGASENFALIGTAGAGLTALGDTRIANLDATVSSRGTSTFAGGAVASVTGNVGGNVTGSVGSVAGNVTGTVASVVGNVGGNVTGTVASVVGNVAGNVTGNVGGNVVGSVASVTTPVALSTTDEALFTSLRAMITSNVYTAPALANAPSGTGASAASIRAEIDTNSTQLQAIRTKTDALSTTPTADIVAAVFAHAVESGVTFAQFCEAVGAVLAGNSTISGGEFAALGNSGTNRVHFTIDGAGNRTITLTL